MEKKENNVFDYTSVSLEGWNLIEASAGTGKTFSITGLYVRLLAEKNIPVEKILVVTFTEAATAELKTKIREKLVEAVGYFSAGENEEKDELFEKLLLFPGKTRESLQNVYRKALLYFDEAAIYTIHGFCSRMLNENAFESGTSFGAELVSEESQIIDEIVEDFWRKHVVSLPLEIIQGLISEGISIEKFRNAAQKKAASPSLAVIPCCGAFNASDSRNISSDGSKLLKHERCPDEEQSAVETDGNAPAERILDIYYRLINKLMSQIGSAREEIKQKYGIRTYSDLIFDLHRALKNGNDNKLKEIIRSKFSAALIDEFQDTDPVQWEIFSTLFLTDEHILFLIGDPKQSIYSFRGADIHAYIKASESIPRENHYTLKYNWRSDERLIAAVNSIFEAPENPFHNERIQYNPVSYPENKPGEYRLVIDSGDDRDKAPFHIWFVDKEEVSVPPKSKKKPFKLAAKARVEPMVLKALASEISRLLCLHSAKKLNYKKKCNGEEQADEFRLGSIAVLVRTNQQGRAVIDELRNNGIPAVMVSKASVFESEEAELLEVVLSAIANPKNLSSVKTALGCDLIGKKGEEIFGIVEDELKFSAVIERFIGYLNIWAKKGFLAMFSKFTTEEKSIERLMEFRDGERRVTNLLHLAELLHRASVEKKLSPEGIIKYLCEKRQNSSEENGDQELRKESDENAIQVVTSHKSKGLEYPIVFCPFLYEGVNTKKNKKEPVFHSEASELIMDIGSNEFENNQKKRQNEELEDYLRLAYVSLTRAKARCYMVWGYINSSEMSAPYYLFHNEAFRNKTSLIDLDIKKDIEELPNNENIVLYEIPTEQIYSFDKNKELPELECRPFTRLLEAGRMIYSYTSLYSAKPGKKYQDANRDEEALATGADLKAVELSGIHRFPAGRKTGECFHKIFETVGFDEIDIRNKIKPILREYRLQDYDAASVEKMFRTVLSARIIEDDTGFTLSMLSAGDRLHETKFYFPLKQTSRKKIISIIQDTRIADSRDSDMLTSALSGYMNGVMDMIFRYKGRYYLVDWKSNRLGADESYYTQERMRQVMTESNYDIQYHIYSVALDMFLSERLGKNYSYDEHFGGVFYLFLRGIPADNASRNGIFFDKPTSITELKNELVDLKYGK